MQISFPFRINDNGLVAQTDENTHIREMIEQLLFTSPGERVNRPELGCGLLDLIYAPISGEVVATTQFTVQSALSQWLGDLIRVENVTIGTAEEMITVTIHYENLRTRERRVETYEKQAD